MANKIKKGEEVTVIAGANKGRTGSVLQVIVDSNKVIVEGVNKRFRHLKPTQTNPKGGRIEKECPIHISNVQLKSVYDAKRAAK